MAWNVLETNEVGTDEFARFAADCGTEVLMAVNLGTGTPKEAAELVDYCNTEKGTAWSDARRGNGSEAPHDFKVWCLGNEMTGAWQINMLKAGEYARKAREAAKMMKWMDPSIKLIACGTCTNEVGHTSYGDWDLAVLEEAMTALTIFPSTGISTTILPSSFFTRCTRMKRISRFSSAI